MCRAIRWDTFRSVSGLKRFDKVRPMCHPSFEMKDKNTIAVFLLILSGNKADWCTNPSPRNVNRSHNSDTSSNCEKWVRGHTRNPAALLISHLSRTTQLSMHCLNSSHSRQLDSVIIKKESWLKKKKKKDESYSIQGFLAQSHFYWNMYLLNLIIIDRYVVWTINEVKAHTIWMN